MYFESIPVSSSGRKLVEKIPQRLDGKTKLHNSALMCARLTYRPWYAEISVHLIIKIKIVHILYCLHEATLFSTDI